MLIFSLFSDPRFCARLRPSVSRSGGSVTDCQLIFSLFSDPRFCVRLRRSVSRSGVS